MEAGRVVGADRGGPVSPHHGAHGAGGVARCAGLEGGARRVALRPPRGRAGEPGARAGHGSATADFANMPGWMKAEHFFDMRQARARGAPDPRARRPEQAGARAADGAGARGALRAAPGGGRAADGAHARRARAPRSASRRRCKGAGGYGKTQLARWLAHQEAVEDAFYDGILWVELGEHPKVHDAIEGLIDELTGEKPGLANVTMAAARLKEVIGDRRMLLVHRRRLEQVRPRPVPGRRAQPGAARHHPLRPRPAPRRRQGAGRRHEAGRGGGAAGGGPATDARSSRRARRCSRSRSGSANGRCC